LNFTQALQYFRILSMKKIGKGGITATCQGYNSAAYANFEVIANDPANPGNPLPDPDPIPGPTPPAPPSPEPQPCLPTISVVYDDAAGSIIVDPGPC